MLTPAQLAARDGKITASFLPRLMAGNAAAILNEWRRLVGDPNWEPENLDDNWPVQFGSYIETFALDWHARKTGQKLVRRGEVVTHPARPYLCCTLDAYRADDDSVIDCKAPGAYRKVDDLLAYYAPQMAAQRACVGASRAALLIVLGGAEPVEYEVTITAEYEGALLERVDALWRCVEMLTPPVALPVVEAPVPVTERRPYDMHGSNAWADAAARFLETREAAANHETAKADIKALVPKDASRAFGCGLAASRAKNNAIRIEEMQHAAE